MNTKAQDIIKFIEEFAPKELAIEGDNIGLQVGNNLNKDIEKNRYSIGPFFKCCKKSKKGRD